MMIWLLLFLAVPCLADSQHFGPKYDSQRTNLEIQHIYQEMPEKGTTPRIYQGAGTPTFAPIKTADIFVSTTTGKVYIATGTANSGSWAIVN